MRAAAAAAAAGAAARLYYFCAGASLVRPLRTRPFCLATRCGAQGSPPWERAATTGSHTGATHTRPGLVWPGPGPDRPGPWLPPATPRPYLSLPSFKLETNLPNSFTFLPLLFYFTRLVIDNRARSLICALINWCVFIESDCTMACIDHACVSIVKVNRCVQGAREPFVACILVVL